MKTLFFGVALIVLVGLGGFFYRNVMEHAGGPKPVACTMEAKVCPDGSSVGRGGPSCEFAACALPNAEDKELGIGFVIPNGYVANADAIGADTSLRAVFDKVVGSSTDNIIIRRYSIPEGKTADDVIIAHTIFETSDMGAKSMDQFTSVMIGEYTFQSVVVERFEAQVHSLYYLPRGHDVLRFEVLERDVKDWMEPKLVVANLPEHKSLIALLSSLQLTIK